MKTLTIKLILAIILTIIVVKVYSEHKAPSPDEVTAPKVTVANKVNDDFAIKKQKIVENCIQEATKQGVDTKLADKNCNCFVKIAEQNYPKNNTIDILMAKANKDGNKEEKANFKIIKQCLEKNKTKNIDKLSVDVIVGQDEVVLPQKSLKNK